MTFNGLNGGEAGEDACVPGQTMVRPGDRTSLKAGGDACVPGLHLALLPLLYHNTCNTYNICNIDI